MKARTAITIIILVFSALSIMPIPNARSQQYIASTSFFTNTQTSTFYQMTHYSVTSTMIGLVSGTVSLTDKNSGGHCEYYVTTFNSVDTPIHIHFSASQPMTIFILDSADLSQPLQALLLPCGAVNGGYRWMSTTSSVGDFDVNLPSVNNPYLMLIVTNYGSTAVVSPYVYISFGTIATVVSSNLTSTVSTLTVLTITATMGIVTTMEVSFMQTYGSWIVALAIVAILAVLAIWLMLKRRVNPRKKRRSPKPRR